MILAIEKGEIDGTLQAWQVWKQSRPAWFEPGGAGVPLIQVGAIADPDAPPVPLLRDLVAEKDRPVVALFDTIGILGRSLAVPPATSDEVTGTLRRAFDDMVKDAAFIAEAQKMQLRILPRSGAELEALIAASFQSSSDDVVARARELTQ